LTPTHLKQQNEFDVEQNFYFLKKNSIAVRGDKLERNAQTGAT
jgi:hypothetical protein